MKRVLLAVFAATLTSGVALAAVCDSDVNGEPSACSCVPIDAWDGTGCVQEALIDFCAAGDLESATGCISISGVHLCSSPSEGEVACTAEECAAAASAACE